MDIRVAAEQARVALQDAWVEQRAWLDDRDLPHDGCVLLPKISAALASLEAALAAQPDPVEAQAVPDQLIKFCCVDCLGCEKCGVTRPTPAAADLHQQIMNLQPHPPGLPHPSDYGSYREGHKEARHAAAQLVAASPAAAAQQSITKEQALESLSEVGLWLSRDPHALRLRQFIEQASPAAAAGVPTGWKLVPREPTPLMVQVAREAESMMLSGPDIYRAMLLASPVAPVGAPTDLGAMWDRFIALRSKNLGVQVKNLIGSAEAMRDDFINANRAQGCELATDATKQLREHSVHLAVNDAEEDFRRRPASSEAAPSAEGSVGNECNRNGG